MVTIYDVAAAAGCSPATVSKVFNSYPGISKKNRDKILEVAKTMGYTPSGTARALSTKKSWLVGMLFSEELATGIKHPHFSEIVGSAQIRLGKAGYDVVFINNFLGGDRLSYLEHCRYRGVDGVFMAASLPFAPAVRCIVDSAYKIVSVEMLYPERYSVLSDNYGGANMAMEYLYGLGHRRIALLSGPLDSLAAQERYNGYRDFLAAHGLPFLPELVVEADEYTAEAGYPAVQTLRQTAGDRFTAVFAAYDDLAISAIHLLREQGLRIPEDVSVIGFDDLSHAALSGLTTIRQNREEIGCLAADILLAQMNGAPLTLPYDVRVPVTLVERASCARPSAPTSNSSIIKRMTSPGS